MYGWTRSARWAGSWPDGWGSRSARPAAAPCEGRSGRVGLGLGLAEELFEEPAGGGTPLALVLAPPVLRPVRAVGRRGQPEERDLADLHARVDGSGVEGIDLDPARGDLLGDGPVGQDHRRPRVLQGRIPSGRASGAW